MSGVSLVRWRGCPTSRAVMMLLLRVRGSGGVCLTVLRLRAHPSQRRLGTCRARLLQLTAASLVSPFLGVFYSVFV
jgi:hypothetical protein